MSAFKRIALIAATSAVVFVSGTSVAGNKVQDAFAEMTGAAYSSSTSAKAYNGTLRSGVDFGSGRVVSGTSTANISLINFTPPQMTAGCGGIDYHLGGISWVNWDQFKDLLDSVLMAAQYAVVNMALDWISEKLGSVFKSVMNALQAATSFEMDACKMGTALVEKAKTSFGVSNAEFGSAICGAKAADDGQTESHAEGFNWCSDVARMAQKVNEKIDGWKAWMYNGFTNPDGTVSARAPAETDQQPARICIGNCTWSTLISSGFVPIVKTGEAMTSANAATNPKVYNALSGVALSELIMSGSGYRMGYAAEAQSGIASDQPSVPKEPSVNPPTMSPAQIMAVFMCGTDYINAATEADLVAANKAAADTTGDASFSETVTQVTVRDIVGVCEQLRKVGSNGATGAQAKVLTCVRPEDESAYAKSEGDWSGVNEGLAAISPDSASFNAYKHMCAGVIEVNIKDWAAQSYVKDTLISEGLLNRNMRVMQGIMVKLILGNQNLLDEEVRWMNAAPMPVYQMLSIASLFPIQGVNMVNSQAMMITVMQTQALLDRLIADAKKNTDPQVPFFQEDFVMITELLGNATRTAGRVNIDVDAQLQRMTAFQGQVKTMQAAVMDSIYGRQLMGNMEFSSDIGQVPATP